MVMVKLLLLSIVMMGSIMAKSSIVDDPLCRDGGDKVKGCRFLHFETNRCGWLGCQKLNHSVALFDEQFYHTVKSVEFLNATLLHVNSTTQENNLVAKKKAGQLEDQVKGLKDLVDSKDHEISALNGLVDSLGNDLADLKRTMSAVIKELEELKNSKGFRKVNALMASDEIATAENVDSKIEQLIKNVCSFLFLGILIFLLVKYFFHQARDRGFVSVYVTKSCIFIKINCRTEMLICKWPWMRWKIERLGFVPFLWEVFNKSLVLMFINHKALNLILHPISSLGDNTDYTWGKNCVTSKLR